MNQKWLILLAALLLCGCQKQQIPAKAAEVPVSAIAVTEPTESVGFYFSDSLPEKATGGAVKAYPLKTDDATGIRFLGDDILLFSGDDATTLTLLSGENRYLKAQLKLPCLVQPDDPAVIVDGRGLAYVDHDSGFLVTLNDQLKEISRIGLPDGCNTPVLSADRRLLYYCTDDALRVLDLETGLDKLLRAMAFPSQKLTQLHCDDTILQCSVVYDDGSQHTLFLAADTGALLQDSREDLRLWTCEDFYIASRMDGDYPEWLTGTRKSEPKMLVLDQEPVDMLPVAQLRSILTYSVRDDNTAFLECYQLESGEKNAQTTVPGIMDLRCPQWNAATDSLWFLSTDDSGAGDVLCAWSPEASAVSVEKSYLQPRWTRTSPNLDGLAQCSLLARQISARHDVNILIWTDAAASQPLDYTLTPEYQVPLLRRKLEELDGILSHYPEGFLKNVASGAGAGSLTICLIRSIDGNPGADALDNAGSLQFWDQEGRPYLAVTLSPDMAQYFHHELFHLIDSRVISTCNIYDDWNKLNPNDFSYDTRYASSRAEEGRNFLTDENRFFTDLYAMCYSREDRASIMEYAMSDGHEDLFRSAPMQAKLRKLCLGIRKAFRLEDEEVIYRWERYLDVPLCS